MNKFKVGDKVIIKEVPETYIAYLYKLNEYIGKTGVVLEEDGGDGDAYVELEDARFYFPYASLKLCGEPATAQEFIINGSSMLFTSLDEAEHYVMHSGFYTDGQTAEIAQVVRRAVVKRTVSVSLEDVQ